MNRALEAIYEGGVFKPLESLDLPEHQRVTIILQVMPVEEPDAGLDAWHLVYSGLSDQDIDEVESIALDRNHLMLQRT